MSPNKHSNPNTHAPTAVFFDMDGTLHKEDGFVAFLLFTAQKRLLITIIFLPMILLGLLLFTMNSTNKMGLNLLLFALLLGLDEHKLGKLIQNFAQHFCQTATFFDRTQTALHQHLINGELVFIITGMPTLIAHAIYQKPNIAQRPNVHIIGSTLTTKHLFTQIHERCFGSNKPKMLYNYLDKKALSIALPLVAGYSDSRADLPMMTLCNKQIWIDKTGNMTTTSADFN